MLFLYYALVAFATRPKEKQHDEIVAMRMTYSRGGCTVVKREGGGGCE